LYYYNTNDGQGEIDADAMITAQNASLDDIIDDDETCDSCSI
jgi:hypothetical protein